MASEHEHGRPHPPSDGGEADTLLGLMEFQCATFSWRCRGLLVEQLHVRISASF